MERNSEQGLLISIGEFIHNQLTTLDHTANNDDERFSMLPRIVALRNECKSKVRFSKSVSLVSGGVLEVTSDHAARGAWHNNAKGPFHALGERNSQFHIAIIVFQVYHVYFS